MPSVSKIMSKANKGEIKCRLVKSLKSKVNNRLNDYTTKQLNNLTPISRLVDSPNHQ